MASNVPPQPTRAAFRPRGSALLAASHPPRTLLAGLLLTLLASLSSCAGVQPAADSDQPGQDAHADDESLEPTETLDFEATVIEVGSDESGAQTIDIWDVDEAFTQGIDLIFEEEYEAALDIFRRIEEVAERDEYLMLAVYNQGLCLEALTRWDEAATAFRRVIDTWPGGEEATHAHYRLAEAHAARGRHEEIPPLMNRVLSRSGLTVEDRMEATLRSGNALLQMRQFSDADQQLRQTIRFYDGPEAQRQRLQSERVNAVLREMYAQAHFQRGRVQHELFSEIRLRLPGSRMRADIRRKTDLIEAARDSYRAALQTGHREWATAAAFMIATSHEDLYYDILAAEIPEDFGELHYELYFSEMRTMLAPMLDQAMTLHESAYSMAFRIDAPHHLRDQFYDAIVRLRAYRDEQQGWEEEERLIVEQIHPRSPGFSGQMQFRLDVERERHGARATTPD